ncbi:DUF6746 family protein [Roseovarius pacificus]|uniref:DUF6746 family protein n=1 Tax=Roseovarius pacificus TaxID=337701 RepID=UPI0025939A3B|nr:DUF6746 family protein [Roseovarius pacificus]
MKHSVKILTTAMAIVLGGLTQAKAEEGVSHYEALPSETLAEAVENFVTYNDKVQEVLARETLSVADMEEIHQFTYTLEIALAKINEELGALPVVLEEVHLASESDNPARLRAVAEVYLEQAEVLDR